MMRKSITLISLLFLAWSITQAQSDDDAFMLKQIHTAALEHGKAYTWLTYLSEEVGGRLAGSPQSKQAIAYTFSELDKLDNVAAWKQKCTVPVWERGEKEQVIIRQNGNIVKNLDVLALGYSGSTKRNGVQASIVEVHSLDEVDTLGFALDGKIVFYNRPFEVNEMNPFHGYGKAVDQRVYGPAKAAKYGAVACLVRSMTPNYDDVPHTGVTIFPDDVEPIPAIAITTNDATWLSNELKRKVRTDATVITSCKAKGNFKSYNVIGEMTGSVSPDTVILIGGHLDSWDVGGGAHDDGAGCVQAMDVLNLLNQIGYTPRYTIRAVLFMNEESGLGGGKAYADSARTANTFHLAAIESDAGGFTPRGFSMEADPEVFTRYYRKANEWLPLLEPYGLTLSQGGSGADIGPLKSMKGLLVGFKPDPQRYFDFHHTRNDRIQNVNERELELGAAAITSLVYLIDKYGLE